MAFTLDWSDMGVSSGAGTDTLVDGSQSLGVTLSGSSSFSASTLGGDDYLRVSGVSSDLTTTVTFSEAVENITFELFDVDASAGSWDDQMTIIAFDADGNEVVIPLSSVTNTTHHNVTNGAQGITIEAEGNISGGVEGSGAGDSVTITIPGPLTSIRFVASNGDDYTNSGVFGISNITVGAVSSLDVDGTDAGEVMGVGYVDGDFDTIDGADGNDDTIYGNGGDDTIFAGAGNDDVYGGTGDDTLNGGAGNDTLSGGEGADRIVLTGGFGTDTVVGGETGTDNDTLDTSGLTSGVSVTLSGDEAGTLTNGANSATFSEIETFDLTGSDDVFDGIASGSSVTVNAGAGDDSVLGTDGDDVIYGGIGSDTIRGAEGDDEVYGEDGNDQIYGNDGADTLYGGDGVDSLFGEIGDDVVYGGAGDDTVEGNEGNDILYGGTGNDYLRGSYGSDSLYGGEGDDYLWMGWGDDTVYLSDNFGNDTILGEGVDETTGDVMDLSAITTDITIDLTSSDPEAGTVSDGTSTATFNEIEHIILSSGTDTLVLGNGSGADVVQAFEAPTDNGDGTSSGNDQLDVSGLDDSGGNPVNTNDVVITDTNGDGTGDAILNFPNGESITLVGVTVAQISDPLALEAIGIPYLPLDYVVEGTGAGELIDGAYTGDPEGDQVDNNDNLAGNNDDSIVAGGGDDTVLSGAGDDVIDAGTGNDSVDAGAGDDSIAGGDGNDDIQGWFGNDTIEGGAGNDTIQGWTGDDSIDGGTGADSIDAGDGDDIITLNNDFGADTIEGGGDAETLGDTLDASNVTDDLTLDLTAGGTEFDAESGSISDGTDTATFTDIENIVLGSGDDSVIGSNGNDTVDTGAGADTVEGGLGNDTFDVGASDGEVDTIVFGDNDGNDTISSFEVPTDNGDGTYTGNDQLDVSDLHDVAGDPVNTGDVSVTDTNGDGTGDAILTFPNGESITLVGVLATDVSSPEQLEAIGIPGPPDYIVEGTGGDDLIDAAYTGDPEGDMVDNSDSQTGTNDDLIEAYGGNDTAYGGVGNDTLYGGAGDDTLMGDAGDDTLFGGDGADELYGGAGEDILNVSSGDAATGGDGDDTFLVGSLGTTPQDITIVGGEGDETSGDTLNFQGLVDDVSDIVYSGGNNEAGTATLTDGSVVTFSEIEHVFVCFAHGTNIMTARGDRAIETLEVGDQVITRDHGMQKIRWVGSRRMPATGDMAPIVFKKGVFNTARDLIVSPQHRMLFKGQQAELLFGTSEVLVPAKHLLGHDGVYQVVDGYVEYFHILFDRHEIIYAEGAATESYHPGDQSMAELSDASRDEIFKIFPQLRALPKTYGAPARVCLRSFESSLLNL